MSLIIFVRIISADVSIPTDHIFVGGEEKAKEGKFIWVNGKPVQGLLWKDGQPDNYRRNESKSYMYSSIRSSYSSYAEVLRFLCVHLKCCVYNYLADHLSTYV